MCTHECEEDADCSDNVKGETCSLNKCVTKCDTDNDCATDQNCSTDGENICISCGGDGEVECNPRAIIS